MSYADSADPLSLLLSSIYGAESKVASSLESLDLNVSESGKQMDSKIYEIIAMLSKKSDDLVQNLLDDVYLNKQTILRHQLTRTQREIDGGMYSLDVSKPFNDEMDVCIDFAFDHSLADSV